MNSNSTNLLNVLLVSGTVIGFATLVLVVLFSVAKFLDNLSKKFSDINDVELSNAERDRNEDRKK